MLEATTSDLSVIAAQLIEAACRARDGDREAAREHIAQAMALFHGKASFGPSVAPCRSLSRREAGVLRMIARGMSNKCIAKSLGITPETVKTHVKAILSKLEARTRAQAVARAEAIGLNWKILGIPGSRLKKNRGLSYERGHGVGSNITRA
jgi:DNA-binding NarL/FixJ family response regulator